MTLDNRFYIHTLTRTLLVLILLMAATNVHALQITIHDPVDLPAVQMEFLQIGALSGSPEIDSSYDLELDFNNDGLTDWNSAAYCINVWGINDTDVVYQATLETPETFTNADNAIWLMDNFSTRIDNGYTLTTGEQWESELALQLAIWSTIYSFDADSATYDTTQISFVVPNSNVDYLYNEYTSSLASFTASGGSVTENLHYEYAVVQPDGWNPITGESFYPQEMITTIGPSPTATPEPATLLLVGVGLLTFAGNIRKRIGKP